MENCSAKVLHDCCNSSVQFESKGGATSDKPNEFSSVERRPLLSKTLNTKSDMLLTFSLNRMNIYKGLFK